LEGGDILPSPGLANSSSSGWPFHVRCSVPPRVVAVATCDLFYGRGRCQPARPLQ
jgi:hypothetical protein